MQDNTEEKELSIDTKAGLEAFLEYAEETYHELSQKIDALEEKGIDLDEEVFEAKKIYKNIHVLVDSCLADLKRHEVIDNEDAENIQLFYNRLTEMIDDLDERESERKEVVSLPIVSAPKKEVVPVYEEPQPVIAPTSVIKPVQREIKSGEDSDTFRDLHKAASVLVEKSEVLLVKYRDIVEVVDSGNEFNVPKSYYAQLSITAKRAASIHAELTQILKDLHAQHLPSVIVNFKHILEEIGKNLELLDTALDGYFEDEESQEDVALPQAPQTKATTPTASIPTPYMQEVRTATEAFSPSNEKITELSNFVKKALMVPEYRAVAGQTFKTHTQFEAALKREIYRIEAPSRLDSVLGVKYASAFSTLLKDLKVIEIESFDTKPRPEIRAILLSKNIPYEVYVAWLDGFYDMIELIIPPPQMTFGELFVRAELELLLHNQNSLSA